MAQNFISGIDLSRLFFEEAVDSLLKENFPDVKLSAALAGDGSEVLGYDDTISTDHDWGPRLHLFLLESDFDTRAAAISDMLDCRLPHEFLGAVGFYDRGRATGLDINERCFGSLRHGVEIFTVRSFFKKYLYVDITAKEPIGDLTWLGLPEQQLLTATAGAVFRDDTGDLTSARNKLAYFPDDIWLHMLSCQWFRIAKEQPFVGRCGEAGDELGSAIVAARLARDLMRLCFLMERRYAPYPKWFGKAFSLLPHSGRVAEALRSVTGASTWQERENLLCQACLEAGAVHRRLSVPGNVQAVITPFANRHYRVVNAFDYVAEIRRQIVKDEVRNLPFRCGAIDQFVDHPAVLYHSGYCQSIADVIHNQWH